MRDLDLGWRRCAECGVEWRAHSTVHGHRHQVRPDDEYCDRCDDLVVNVCGTARACREREEERERDLEEEAGGRDALMHDRGICHGPGVCRWCDQAHDEIAELEIEDGG